MTTTLQDVRDNTRSAIDESIAQFWGDDELDRWIRQALNDIARRSRCIRKDKVYTVIADQESYTAPDDLVRIYRVEYRQSQGDTQALEYRDFNGMDEIWYTSRETSGGRPSLWTFWGTPGVGTSQIYLYPIPSETINNGLRVFYFGLPKKLVNPEDAVEIPTGWDDLIPLYVEAHARRKESKDNRWKDAFELYEKRIEEMKGTLLHPSDQQRYISPDSWESWGDF